MTSPWKCPLCGWEPLKLQEPASMDMRKFVGESIRDHKLEHFPEAVANARRLGALEWWLQRDRIELYPCSGGGIAALNHGVADDLPALLDALADAQESKG